MNAKRKRVLYLLDYGTLDTDALRLAGIVSGDGDVEIVGLYVEDEDLINAMRLPGLKEVRMESSQSESLDSDRLRKDLAVHAAGLRRSFESSASRHQLRYSYRVVRGRPSEAVVDAAAQSDFVVVSRALRSAGLRARQAGQYGPLVQAQKNVLFVNEPWASGSRIVFICEGDPVSDSRALDLARRLADVEGLPLVVGTQEPLAIEQADRVHQVVPWDEQAIVEFCEAQDARLLVLSELKQLDWRTLMLSLAERLSCSLLRLEA